MAVSDWVAIASLLLSVGAFGYSVYTGRKAARLDADNARLAGAQTDMQQRMLEIERGRDELQASLLRSAELRGEFRVDKIGVRHIRLRVQNDGSAMARSVRLFLDGKPPDREVWKGTVPTELGPGAKAEIGAVLYDGFPFPSELRIEWFDDQERDWTTRVVVEN